MSIWSRLASVFGAKANAALDRLEDPRETLEAAYRTQVAALQDARRGVADVLTSEKRLELEADALRANGERSTQAAAEAAAAGDDAGARRALEREAFAALQRDRLLAEVAQIRAQRAALESLAEGLQRRVELFRTEKLALSARYAAAKAISRAGEDTIGISDGTADVASMVERAQDRSREAQARAAALLELADTPGASSLRVDPARIEQRLAALKGETPPQLSNERN